MRKLLMAVLACLAFGRMAGAAGMGTLTVRVRPDPVYMERSGDRQLLSFDFELANGTQGPLDLAQIRMQAYDKAGQLLVWDKVDSNGSRPSIEALGPRHLDPGKPLTVFNPFFEIDTAAPVDLLRFTLVAMAPGGGRQTATVDVHPVVYKQKTKLILPVPGARVWAYEAPGFFSHHRRLDLNNPFNRDVMKMRRNSQRYALDLSVVDEHGEAFHGDIEKKENWIGFEVPVVAPAPGTIVAAVSDRPDDIPYDESLLPKDPGLMIGNYVIIDHENGEYSLLAHFQHGSLAVKPGDRVRRGQLLGKMSHSGMGSTLVHVHYELRNTPDLFDADGLPATFEGFRRVGSAKPEKGHIEPGWVVLTDPIKLLRSKP